MNSAGGPNELKEGHRISPIRIFLGQFQNVIIWILVAAGVVSEFLGDAIDASAILAIVVLNAIRHTPGTPRTDLNEAK